MSPSPESTASDPLFGLVAGLYLALLATPLVLFAVTTVGVEDAGTLYGVVLTSIVSVTGFGWAMTTRRDDLATRLGRTSARWLPAAAPVPYALLGFASLSDTGIAGVVAFFFGTFAMFIGFVLGVMARTRYTLAMLADSPAHCKFTARLPMRVRRRYRLVAGSLIVVAAIGFIVGVVTDTYWSQIAGQLLFPVGVSLGVAGEKRTYTVTDVGLEQRIPVARRLFPPTAFDSYSRTHDALVLSRRWRPDMHFAITDLDDPDAVERAFARMLSRR